MRVDTWRLYPIFALAVLAGGSVWLERITRIDDPVTSAEQTGPDFIAHDTRVVGFSALGVRPDRERLGVERERQCPRLARAAHADLAGKVDLLPARRDVRRARGDRVVPSSPCSCRRGWCSRVMSLAGKCSRRSATSS